MTAGPTPTDVARALAAHGLDDPATRAMFDALDPDAAVGALHEARFPQHAAHARGTALEPRFDHLLRPLLADGWADDVQDIVRTGLLAMPPRRREALVLGERVCWDHLGVCRASPEVVDAAVAAAVEQASPPPTHHPAVRGLVVLGPPAGPAIARVLGAGVESAAAAPSRPPTATCCVATCGPDPTIRC